jgi:hypothetical protein
MTKNKIASQENQLEELRTNLRAIRFMTKFGDSTIFTNLKKLGFINIIIFPDKKNKTFTHLAFLLGANIILIYFIQKSMI